MAQYFNKLTPAEAERLAILLEELGEAQQAIGKILRHGYQSMHPDRQDGPTNRESLQRELGDVMAIIDMMDHADDLSHFLIDEYKALKLSRIAKYLHHQ